MEVCKLAMVFTICTIVLVSFSSFGAAEDVGVPAPAPMESAAAPLGAPAAALGAMASLLAFFF